MKARFLQVEPTTRCNYTCGFCVGRHLPQQDLELDRFRQLMERIEGLEALELQAMPQYARIYDQHMLGEVPDEEASSAIDHAVSASPALRSALHDRQKLAHTGFYERLYGSVDLRFQCPWLANGLYMATGGELVPCCHVKDYERHAFSRIDEDEGKTVDAGRAGLRRQLAQGKIPVACEGCQIADTVARNSLKMRAAMKKRFR